MNEQAPNRPGLLETLRRLAATILAIFQNRLQLLVVELQLERICLFNARLLAVAPSLFEAWRMFGPPAEKSGWKHRPGAGTIGPQPKSGYDTEKQR